MLFALIAEVIYDPATTPPIIVFVPLLIILKVPVDS